MSALDELWERYRAILADSPGEWLTLRVHYALEAAENIIAEMDAERDSLRKESLALREALWEALGRPDIPLCIPY